MEYLRRRAGGGAVLSGFCRRLIVTYAAFAVLEPEAVAVELEDVNVVSKAIEQRASGALGGEHAGPVCGELLILGKSVIRHTQHPEARSSSGW
jgi:hypothetical protein